MNEAETSTQKRDNSAIYALSRTPELPVGSPVRNELYASFIKRQVGTYATLPVIWTLPALMAAQVAQPLYVAIWWLLSTTVAMACRARLKALQSFYRDGQATKRSDREIVLLLLSPSLMACLLPLALFPSDLQSLNFVVLLSTAGALIVSAAAGPPNINCFFAAAAPHVAALLIASLRANDPFMPGFLLFFVILSISAAVLADTIRKDRQKHIESALRLAEALEAMRAANNAKSQFLAAMSHELRTPLNAIMGFSEVIATQTLGPVGSVKYLEYAKDIHFSGSHLLNLINDVLDLAKIEAGKIEIVRRDLDPLTLIHAATRMISPRARENNVTVRTIFDAHGVMLYADERAATQILLNILSNAVKFNNPGGEIAIECKSAAENGVLFIVRDSGPGIPEDQIERLFEPFEQGENGFNRGKGGTGLGLAIVRSLMKMHGGAVWLESQVGEGTTVYILFPANPETIESVPRDIRRAGRGRS